MCPLQDGGKRGLVLYMVVETEWVKAHLHLLQKNAQDQNNPEHEEFKKRYEELRDKHASEIKEDKPIIQLWQHGYKRPRVHWSIELFESKRRAIGLVRQKLKRRVLEPQSHAVLAVQFSTQALAEALIEIEEETSKFKTLLLREENKDIESDRRTWSWNGPLLPLFSDQVSAWITSMDWKSHQHGLKAVLTEHLYHLLRLKQRGQLRAVWVHERSVSTVVRTAQRIVRLHLYPKNHVCISVSR